MKLPAVWIAAAFAFGIALARVVAGGTAAWILLAWCGLGGLASRLEQTATGSNNVARLLAEGKIDASEPKRTRSAIPTPGLSTRYEAGGVRLLRMDHDGAVTAWTDGHALSVHSFIETNAP